MHEVKTHIQCKLCLYEKFMYKIMYCQNWIRSLRSKSDKSQQLSIFFLFYNPIENIHNFRIYVFGSRHELFEKKRIHLCLSCSSNEEAFIGKNVFSSSIFGSQFFDIFLI